MAKNFTITYTDSVELSEAQLFTLASHHHQGAAGIVTHDYRVERPLRLKGLVKDMGVLTEKGRQVAARAAAVREERYGY
jgi:hypothetical protein